MTANLIDQHELITLLGSSTRSSYDATINYSTHGPTDNGDFSRYPIQREPSSIDPSLIVEVAKHINVKVAQGCLKLVHDKFNGDGAAFMEA